MYLLYVDETGDTGITGSPTRYFALSGLVVHESDWGAVLDATIAFRRSLRKTYGLKLREEIHATEFMHRPGELARIQKWHRLRILRDVLDFEATMNGQISILNVVVDKVF